MSEDVVDWIVSVQDDLTFERDRLRNGEKRINDYRDKSCAIVRMGINGENATSLDSAGLHELQGRYKIDQPRLWKTSYEKSMPTQE